MQNRTISPEQLSDAIKETLDTYDRAVLDGVKKQSKESMDKLVKQTKATAPVGHRKRHYKNSITSKKVFENTVGAEYLWYVKAPDYRLSHLLEFGHAKKNGGRTKAYGFIGKATDEVTEEYITKIEEICKNGAN